MQKACVRQFADVHLFNQHNLIRYTHFIFEWIEINFFYKLGIVQFQLAFPQILRQKEKILRAWFVVDCFNKATKNVRPLECFNQIFVHFKKMHSFI